MNAPLLELRNVTRTFAVRDPESVIPRTRSLTAVDRVTFRLTQGRTLGLVGESGSGKTTVGNIVAGHLRADAGEVLLEGTPIPSRRDRAITRSIQMIFQDPLGALDPRWSVDRQIREPLDIFGDGSEDERRRRVDEYLRMVGLSEEQGRAYPHQLSGGQRQRVVAARAMILEPRILICDEPVSALDVSIQAQVLNLLMELQRTTGCSYLFITHDLRVVRHISQEVMVMYMGRIVESGDTEELFRRPLHPYTQALLSAVPQPEVRRTKERIILEGDPPSPLDLPVGCRFAGRCPFVHDRCRREEPREYELGPDHTVACFLSEDL